jgi:hypothetical protein
MVTAARHLALSFSVVGALGSSFILFADRLPFSNMEPHQELVQDELHDGQQQHAQMSQGQINALQQRVATTQQEFLAQQVDQRRHELQLALIEADKLREELDALRQQRQVAEARLQQLTSNAAVLEAKQTEAAHCPTPSVRSLHKGSRKGQR